MKRWIAAFVAVLFLATATLHVLAHHGGADADCGVCHVQQASLAAAPAPVVAAGPMLEAALSEAAVPQGASRAVARAAARAPPALSA
ncbi:MAG TPA: hypothetical protein VN915_11300 [Elusimicrobiota bacterium]|nr:hypothetical protein [Elusimicrobiota bacterium]